MRSAEGVARGIVDQVCSPHLARLLDEHVADLIRARDAEVAEQVRAETLAGLTEERADRMVPRFVPCDCPGDWQHHARLVGDDSPAQHVMHDVVPSVRLVSPWEPDPRTPEERSADAITALRSRLCEEPEP